jgi:hypothetical protein
MPIETQAGEKSSRENSASPEKRDYVSERK